MHKLAADTGGAISLPQAEPAARALTAAPVSIVPAAPVAAGAEAAPRIREIGGWACAHHDILDSTNLEARRMLAGDISGKRIILADRQTNGQCRHDRLWESPAGKGMWASFILPVSVPLEYLAQSTLVLAVAVRDAVNASCGVNLQAKWPNDLLAEGRKCCGMLVETTENNTSEAGIPLILGVGVNLTHESSDFPEYLRDAATSLRLLGGNAISREIVLRAIAANIDHWFGIWEKEGFSPVRSAWLRGNCTIDKKIILPEGYGYSRATAYDLDNTGALVALADDGTALLIDSGEIRFTNATSFPS